MSYQKLLDQIYQGQDNSNLEREISHLVKEYSAVRQNSRRAIDQNDVVLITYGDTVVEKGEKPLNTLHKVVNELFEGKISTIHILPFYPYSSDDGFSVIDYEKVDEKLGNWEDVKKIASDSRLMFDAVINHISAHSEWLQEYLLQNKPYDSYFVEKDDSGDWSHVVRPRTSPLFHTYKGKNGVKQLWTTFSQDQVDLNYESKELLMHVIKILLAYIEKGAELIRLDAVGFLWKESGTTCIHLEKTHSIIKLIRKVLVDVLPQVKIITETNVPHAENISYLGNGSDEAHMVYNFTLPPLLAFSLLSGKVDKLKFWLKDLPQPTTSAYFFNFLASHDGIGVRPVEGLLEQAELDLLIKATTENGGKVSYKSNPDGSSSPYELNTNYCHLLFGAEKDEKTGIRRSILAHALLLVLPGLPAIYFHSLVGSLNDLDGLRRKGYNRAINREKLDFGNLAKDLKDKTHRRNFIYSAIAGLIDARSGIKELQPSQSFEVLDTSSAVLGIKRGVSFYSYFNFSSTEVTISLNEKMKDVISKKEVDTLTLKPLEYSWLCID